LAICPRYRGWFTSWSVHPRSGACTPPPSSAAATKELDLAALGEQMKARKEELAAEMEQA
jgi:hypothetical protein